MDSLPYTFYEDVISCFSHVDDHMNCTLSNEFTLRSLKSLNGFFEQAFEKSMKKRFCLNISLVFKPKMTLFYASHEFCQMPTKIPVDDVFKLLNKPGFVNIVRVKLESRLPLNENSLFVEQSDAFIQKLFLSLRNVRTSFNAHLVDLEQILDKYPCEWMEKSLFAHVKWCDVKETTVKRLKKKVKNCHFDI